MEIHEARIEGVLVVGVAGRLDTTTSGALEAKLLAAVASGERRLVLDCARLEYVSSAGLRVLLVAAKRLREVGGSIALAGLQEQVREVLDIAGLTGLFAIFPDRAAALAGGK